MVRFAPVPQNPVPVSAFRKRQPNPTFLLTKKLQSLRFLSGFCSYGCLAHQRAVLPLVKTDPVFPSVEMLANSAGNQWTNALLNLVYYNYHIHRLIERERNFSRENLFKAIVGGGMLTGGISLLLFLPSVDIHSFLIDAHSLISIRVCRWCFRETKRRLTSGWHALKRNKMMTRKILHFIFKG